MGDSGKAKDPRDYIGETERQFPGSSRGQEPSGVDDQKTLEHKAYMTYLNAHKQWENALTKKDR